MVLNFKIELFIKHFLNITNGSVYFKFGMHIELKLKKTEAKKSLYHLM